MSWLRGTLLALLACGQNEVVPVASAVSTAVDADPPPALVVHLQPSRGLLYCNTCFLYAEPDCVSFPLHATWSRSATMALFITDAPVCRLIVAAVSSPAEPLVDDVLAVAAGGWTEERIQQDVVAFVQTHQGRLLGSATLAHVPTATRVTDDGSSVFLYSGIFSSPDVPLIEFRDAKGRLVGSVARALEMDIPIDGFAPPGWFRRAALLWVDASGQVVVAEKATSAEDASAVHGWRCEPDGGCLPLDAADILASARSILAEGRPDELDFAADVVRSAGESTH